MWVLRWGWRSLFCPVAGSSPIPVLPSKRDDMCWFFHAVFPVCLLHLTTPVCKVRFCVGFQESSLIPKIIFSVLNQIPSQRLRDSIDFFGSVKSVHRDLNLISCGF